MKIHPNPKARILAHMRAHRFDASIPKLAAAVGISVRQTHRYLKQMLDDGLLCQISGHYYPACPEENGPAPMTAEQHIEALRNMGYEITPKRYYYQLVPPTAMPDQMPAETVPDLPAPNPLD